MNMTPEKTANTVDANNLIACSITICLSLQIELI